MTHYALISDKFEKGTLPPKVVGKEVTWFGEVELPPQPDGQVIVIPVILAPAVKATKVVTQVVDEQDADLVANEDAIRPEPQVVTKISYTFDPDLLLQSANVDYGQFLEDYETSGLEEILTRSSNNRAFQILTVDVMTLGSETTLSTYQRIVRNLESTLQGLTQEDLDSALTSVNDLLQIYPLPFTVSETGGVNLNI